MPEAQTPTRRSPTLREYHGVILELAEELRGNFTDVAAKLDIVVQKLDEARTRVAVLESQHVEVGHLRQENRDLRSEVSEIGKTVTEIEVRVRTNAAWISLGISAALSLATGLAVKFIH